MTSLTDVLETLAARGLLDRAAYIKAGDVEVQLGPPGIAPLGDVAPQRPPTIEEEMAVFDETMYGATRGRIPGVT